MDSAPVLVEKSENGIVKIILNRPKALNALNVDLLEGLTDALRQHSGARIIVIEGAGDRSFCAGEDLKQTLAPKTGTAAELRESFHKLQDITRLTSSAQAIVISAVQGFAIGGGAEVALAADFVIGGPGARFRFPEVPIGHAATGGITMRIVHLVGLLKAKELLLTGRWVSAEEALKLGMLSELHQDPKTRAMELATQLAGLPAIALSSSKTSLERSVFTNMEACLQDEVNVASYCFAQSAANKAFADFAARKAPKAAASTNGNGVLKSVIRDINTAWARAVQAFPDRTFLRFAGQDLTFSVFDAMIAKLAGGLRSSGVVEGHRVMAMMRNSVEMVCYWLAANRLGAVWVPVNTELKSVTLRHVIEAAQPIFAIVDEELWPDLKQLDVVNETSVFIKPTPGTLNGESTLPKAFSTLLETGTLVIEPVPVKPATTSAFLYTSGSTGKSKPCVLSHEYFILQAETLIGGCGLRSDDVLYCPFPLFHADATALTVIPAILLGAVAALSPRFSASRFWDEIRAAKATVYDFMGATLALTYKQHPTDRDRDHNVRLAWGVPIPQFAQKYEQRFGHRLITLYGSVEASLPVFQDISIPLPPGSCGRPRKGHQLRIVDDDGEEVPVNTPGHLLLRSDNPNAFFKGYFNDPESTASSFASLWLHTGDVAKVDEDGNVYFVGRAKDVIRRRGENISAVDVEEEFLQHADVIVAAAYGIPSRLGSGTEEELKVAVQVRAGSSIDEEGLWKWSLSRMARFQVPSVIEFVQSIDKTPTGKVEKRSLKIEGGKQFDIRKS